MDNEGLAIRCLTPKTLSMIVAELSEAKDLGELEPNECIELDRIRTELIANVGYDQANHLIRKWSERMP